MKPADATESFAASMLANCRSLYATAQFHDICITAMNYTFKLHRAVICANPYFASMLNGRWHENTKQALQLVFDDPNITLDAIKIVIARLYGIFDHAITFDNVIPLLATSNYFTDTTLTSQCIAYITATLSPQTTAAYLAFADANFHGEHTAAVTHACLVHLCKTAAGGDARAYAACLRAAPRRWRETVMRADWLFVEDEAARVAVIEDVYANSDGEMCGSGADLAVHGGANCVSAGDDCVNAAQNSHVRHGSDASTRTLIAGGESESPIREEGGSDSFAVASSGDNPDSSEAEKSAAQVLSESVIFSNIPFKALKDIQSRHPTVAPAIQRGLWQQQDLRLAILDSPSSKVDLGVSYRVLTENESEPALSERTLAPAQDTETMDGWSRVVGLIMAPPKWGSVRYPPCRFGYAFTKKQLSIIEETADVKVHSSQTFYGGSNWQLYLQKLDGDDGPALGIYMQRLSAESSSADSTGDISSYHDKRFQVKVWFQIVCYTSSSCCILESKPDVFKISQSWGWRSTKMYADIFSAEPGRREFKCVAVIGHT